MSLTWTLPRSRLAFPSVRVGRPLWPTTPVAPRRWAFDGVVRPEQGRGRMMSSRYLIDGLPREIEEWLHTAVDADIGRINLLAYTLAR